MEPIPQPIKVQEFEEVSGVEHLIANIFCIDPQMHFFSILVLRRTKDIGTPLPADPRPTDEPDLIIPSEECRLGDHILIDMFHRANVKDLNMVVGSSYDGGLEPIPNEAFTFLLTYAPDDAFGRMHNRAPQHPAIAAFCAVGRKLYHYSQDTARMLFAQLPVQFQNFEFVKNATASELLPYIETPWAFLNRPLSTDAKLPLPSIESHATIEKICSTGISLPENPGRVFGKREYDIIRGSVYEIYFRWLVNGCEHIAYFEAGCPIGVPRSRHGKLQHFLKLRDWLNCARSGHSGIIAEPFPSACFAVEYPDPATAPNTQSQIEANQFEQYLKETRQESFNPTELETDEPTPPAAAPKFDPMDHASPHAPRFISYNYLHQIGTEVIEKLHEFFMEPGANAQPAWRIAIGLDQLINERRLLEHLLVEIGDRDCEEAVELYERHYKSII